MIQNQSINKKYDLEERTAKFGQNVIKFCKGLPKSELTGRIIDQLVGCSNYCEADDAESPRDFKHKIGICKKESRESKHFLRMSAVAVPEKADQARRLWVEAKELNLIFNSIYKKVK